ncbi:DNA recombination protein RmuC [Candidatus Bipolaricaulota bacterium]|nr:DNA recombination protein RmuC [Candidatus Bipolaricaulota bacterium]
MDAASLLVYALCALAGVLIGVLISSFFRRGPDIGRLEQRINELQQRLDDWQRATATQQQITQLQSDLDAAQISLTELGTKLASLGDFTQNILHRTTSESLTSALTKLGELREALSAVALTLSDQSRGDTQRHSEVLGRLQKAAEDLAKVQTTLSEVSTNLRTSRSELGGAIAVVQQDLKVAKSKVEEINQRVSVLISLSEAVERIEDNLGQLTSALLGRASGRVGEQLVEELLQVIPDDWIERNAKLGTGEVEFAIKMPGGYLIPLDSKFVAPELLQRLKELDETDSPEIRADLEKQLEQQLRKRAGEVKKYLSDQKTLGFGLAAVPDPVYGFCRYTIKRVAQDSQVVVVPYSLLLPFVLSLYLMAQRLGISAHLGDTQQAVGTALSCLAEAKDKLENMVKQLTAIGNQREEALKKVNKAISALEDLKGDHSGPIATQSAENQVG